MVTFILLQSVWEFAKSLCQCAKSVPIIQPYMPSCQKHANFLTLFQKNISIFELFNYAQYLQILRIFGQF